MCRTFANAAGGASSQALAFVEEHSQYHNPITYGDSLQKHNGADLLEMLAESMEALAEPASTFSGATLQLWLHLDQPKREGRRTFLWFFVILM